MTIWIGSPTDVRTGDAAEQAIKDINDSQYWNDETGITKVSENRWKQAQQFEECGWLGCWNDSAQDRNSEHFKGFDEYKAVPDHLGNVLEIGCGPFTQLQTVQKGRTFDNVILLDPLIEKYLRLSNCPYKNYTFFGHDVELQSCKAEEMRISENNTIICINVLEHVQDVMQVLSRLLACLVDDGIVIFGERTYDGFEVQNHYDVGHPARIKNKIIVDFFKMFKTLFHNIDTHEHGLTHYFIGQKLPDY